MDAQISARKIALIRHVYPLDASSFPQNSQFCLDPGQLRYGAVVKVCA